jgi:hypothetical protein
VRNLLCAMPGDALATKSESSNSRESVAEARGPGIDSLGIMGGDQPLGALVRHLINIATREERIKTEMRAAVLRNDLEGVFALAVELTKR